MTEWNDWRDANPKEKIVLQGAILREAHLEGAKFDGARLEGAELVGANLKDASLREAHLEHAWLGNASLRGAELWGAHLENAQLHGANLKGAKLHVANLKGAILHVANLDGAELHSANLKGAELGGATLEDAVFIGEANLEGARLRRANLKGAKFDGANLKGAILTEANLKGAKLIKANLEGARLWRANLEGAGFDGANLEGAELRYAVVNGGTLITDCKIDRETDFTGVGLSAARVDPGLKQLLEYNIRRKLWGRYIADHLVSGWFVRRFWEMSDYGRSTLRICRSFITAAIVFAIVYVLAGLVWYSYTGEYDNPLVANLTYAVQTPNGPVEPVPGWIVPFRAMYFSIVTMTTLGFGDIYAQPQSVLGYALLTVQVILGYVMLGALVTRFAILFAAGGPSAQFDDELKPFWHRTWQALLAKGGRVRHVLRRLASRKSSVCFKAMKAWRYFWEHMRKEADG